MVSERVLLCRHLSGAREKASERGERVATSQAAAPGALIFVRGHTEESYHFAVLAI